MNEIKIYLKESGSTAELYKDFNLYKGCYRNAQITVYVPQILLYRGAGKQNDDQEFTNAVKIGATLTGRNGKKVVTQSYFLNFVKNETYNGMEYAVFTRLLPKEFTVYEGAQTVVANVVSIDQTDPNAPQFLGITTSQTVVLTVLDSAYLDGDEAIEPSQTEMIITELDALRSDLCNGAYAARAIYPYEEARAYGGNELVYYPQTEKVGAILKSKVNENDRPPYIDGELNGDYWELLFDFNMTVGPQGERGQQGDPGIPVWFLQYDFHAGEENYGMDFHQADINDFRPDGADYLALIGADQPLLIYNTNDGEYYFGTIINSVNVKREYDNMQSRDVVSGRVEFVIDNPTRGASGQKGDTGNGISSTVITYATSTSGTIPPSSGWQSSVPMVAQGQYLWTRTVNNYTNRTTKTSYSVAYQGKDGPRGADGGIGPQGPQGLPGERGPKGADGRSFVISGQADSAAQLPTPTAQYLGDAFFVGTTEPRDVYVCVEYNGALSWEAQGTLQGPQGEQGVQGVQGLQGIPGPKGDQGEQGPPGPQGEYAAVDSELSETSTNPVQNKVVTEILFGLRDGDMAVAEATHALSADEATHATSANNATNAVNANSAGTAATATKLGSSTIGGTTTPIYLSSGTPTACSRTIPAVTLNGSSNTSPSFYAPTSAGSGASQFLSWSDYLKKPTWQNVNFLYFNSITCDSSYILCRFVSDYTNDRMRILARSWSFTAKGDSEYTYNFEASFSYPPVVVATCGSWYNSSYACQLGITEVTTTGFKFKISGSTISKIYFIAIGKCD